MNERVARASEVRFRASNATARASPTMAGFWDYRKRRMPAMLLEDAAWVVFIVALDQATVDKVGAGKTARELVVV